MTPTTVPCPWCGAEVPDTTPDCPQCQREVVVAFAPRVESAAGQPPAVAPLPEPDPPELTPLGSPPSKGWFSGIAVDQPTLHTTEPPHGPGTTPATGYGRWLLVYAVMVTVFAVWGWVRAMR